MNDREAYVVLNAVCKVGPVRARALVDRFGSPAAVLAAPANRLRETHGIGPEAAAAVTGWREAIDPDVELGNAAAAGISVLVPGDAAYPEPLAQIHDPPLALYVRGSLEARDAHAVAMVGSRRSTLYGRGAAERLAAGAARCGLTVVSGLARGIDTAAHRGALRGGGRTIAVVGCGVDVVYPAENAELSERIADQGAVIGEFPLGTPPERSNFPMRNRIISGMSLGVVVVEAGDRSGALITADVALDQGRPVLAVPGRIDSASSRGTHRLIKQGARLVDSIDDVLDEFGWLFRDGGGAGPGVEPDPAPAIVDLEPDERAVFDAVGADPTAVDAVIRASGLHSGIVSSILLRLEMRRLVRQLPGKLFVRRMSGDIVPQPEDPSASSRNHHG